VIGFRPKAVMPANIADWLDLARGLAAVEVLAFHAYQLMFREQLPGASYDSVIVFAYSVVWALSAHGVAAVMVFFVLSGYLVGGPAIVRARNGVFDAIDYFSARAARLYVVLIPALVISFCAYVSAKHMAGWQAFTASRHDFYDASGLFSARVNPGSAICNSLFLQTIICEPFAGNLALWSLSNEFWYYVLIFALIAVRKTPSLALLIVGIFMLFVVAERSDVQGTHNGLKFFLYFSIWFFGAVVYAVVAPVLAWLVAFLICLGGVYLLSVSGLLPSWAAYHLAIGLLTGAAILSVESTKISLPSFLRFTKELAKFSFSLYAIHYPILLLLNVTAASSHNDFTFASLGIEAVFILCCLAASFIFYLLLERHTYAIRIWVRNIWRRGASASYDVRRPTAELEIARPQRAIAEDHVKPATEHPRGSYGASMAPP
jgi:peptidoglycan/LPS O-acetylase OafA/YrhL